MKIIGKSVADKWIIEATDGEIQKIAGSYYDGNLVKIGATIDVSKIYDNNKKISNGGKDIKYAIDILNSITRLLEPIENIFNESSE